MHGSRADLSVSMGSQLHFLSRLLVGAFLTQFFLLRLSDQTDLAEALESDLLEWEATPVDAWRAVESPSAKVGGNMVSYFGGGSDDRYRGTLSATVSGPATISLNAQHWTRDSVQI